MIRWLNLTHERALLTLAALMAASLAVGCAAHVEGGGRDDDGDGGGGGNGGGGNGGGGGGNGGDDSGGDGGNGGGGSYDACKQDCQAEASVCDAPCTPGDTFYCPLWPQAPTLNCVTKLGCSGRWSGNCATPLVLSFDSAPVDFTPAAASFDFDLTGTSTSVPTDWPTARTPWLALDRDDDGRINGGEELFGSATRLAEGSLAVNGFVALRELDTNGDGQITPEDTAWSRLLLWSDRDGDRASTAGELAPVSSRKLLSIDLGYTTDARCDARGNCEVERATFRYLDEAGAERTGLIVDVHLRTQGRP